MRLIDADELYRKYSINDAGQRIRERDCDNFPITVSIAEIKKDIRNATTIEIIKCKDCIKFRNYDERLDTGECSSVGVDVFHRSFDYCSYAERRQQ